MNRERLIGYREDALYLLFGSVMIVVAFIGCVVLLVVIAIISIKDFLWKLKPEAKRKQKGVATPVPGYIDPEDC